jgi:DNA ligase D-like protein (predicted 3'-phosphoesterase)
MPARTGANVRRTERRRSWLRYRLPAGRGTSQRYRRSHHVDTVKLSPYRAKRDFSKTIEPRGDDAQIRPAPYLRFVIQKHAASHVHYDLRLELDGVFKSWAVPKGPSLDPEVRRSAFQVEDHPLEYGDFEGTISASEYGGGTVQLWDRGYWTPAGQHSAREALHRGALDFVMEGERWHGEWLLLRAEKEGRSDRRRWLLIKRPGAGALPGEGDRVLEVDRSVASGRTMSEIAAGQGRGRKPFMLAGRRSAAADAVWRSNRADAPPRETPVEKRPARVAGRGRAAARRAAGLGSRGARHALNTCRRDGNAFRTSVTCTHLVAGGDRSPSHGQTGRGEPQCHSKSRSFRRRLLRLCRCRGGCAYGRAYCERSRS